MAVKRQIEAGSIFGKLTILSEVCPLKTGQETKRAVQVKCQCGNIFIVRFNALITGNTISCGCSGPKYVTPKNRNLKLMECLVDTNIVRTDDVEILEGTQNIKLKCLICKSKMTRVFNVILKKETSCLICLQKLKLTSIESQRISNLNLALNNTTLTYHSKVIDTPLKYSDNVYLYCSDCNNKIKRRYDVAVTKRYMCPCKVRHGFKSTKPSILYLLSITAGDIIGYKYGITNNLSERLSILKRNCSSSVDLVMHWEYDQGEFARLHEKTFKNKFKNKLNKSNVQDGYTETFYPEVIEEFLEIQTSQYLEMHYGRLAA